jgi:SEL1 protein
MVLTNMLIEQKKDWSLSEWIANFLQDDGYEYDDYYADDLYDDTIDGSIDGFDEGGVVESALIISLMAALVFLLWWRQRIQQAHAEAEEARRREQGLPHQPPAARVNPPDAFQGWAAGGNGL